MPATQQKNLYDLLGVPKGATKDAIRKAYLKLAKQYHPDKTGGDKAAEERLKEINAAYDILKNDEKRRQYDAMLDNPRGAGGGFAGGGEGFAHEGFSFDFGGADGFGFEDLLSGLFGGGARQGGRGRRRQAVRPGRDLEVTLDITLREAAAGTRKTVRINRHAACKACRGTGAAGGAQPESCPGCQGSGQVRQGNGAVFMARPCPSCKGTGQVVSHPCTACQGAGSVREPHTVTVSIPAGAANGMRLRLQGQGDAGGAGAGDLYVAVRVQDDPVFRREGDDLHCEAPVPFTRAALGGTVRVPTLHGQAELKIPAGTQSGRVFRLRGQGMPRLKGGKGDLLVTVRVTVPTRLTPAQRELIEKLDALG